MRRRLPLAFVVLGVIGAGFVALPVLGLALRAPWGRIVEILTGPGARTALRLSIEVSLLATLCSVVFGVPLAWILARGTFRGRAVLRALVILPLVLPPVVAGVGLLQALGRRGIVGGWLDRVAGIQVTFTTAGAVIAATFVSIPLVVLSAEAGFRSLDPRFERAAAVLGASPGYTLRRVVLPHGRTATGGGRRARVGARARRVRRHDHVRRQPRGAHADPAVGRVPKAADRPGGCDRVVARAGDLVDLRPRRAPRAHHRDRVMPLDVDVEVKRGERTIAVSFSVADGETVALVGRNGAGKTTALEAIAGTRAGDRTSGARRPVLDGASARATWDRGHLPRRDAVPQAERARERRVPAARREARAATPHVSEPVRRSPTWRPPSIRRRGLATLSGGERQRVALARALAAEPRVLLLDEPFASVDAEAKPELRSLLRRTLASFGGPRVLVTHDPVEATTLADRLVLLEDGRVTQTGTPSEVRGRPVTRYAAELVGTNLFEGSLIPDQQGVGILRTATGELTVVWPDGLAVAAVDDVRATLSPAEIALHTEEPHGSARNVFRGAVEEVATVGGRARIRLRTSPPLVAELTTGSVERLGIVPGREVWASCKAVEIRLMVPGGEPDTL